MSFISPVSTDSNGNVKTGGTTTLNKDDFLNLLITKLRYQDPMNPTTDEDFIAQLAQFSSLEQMNNIADGITTSNKWDLLQMQSLNNAMAAGFIGKEVTADYDTVYYQSGGSSKISFTSTEAAQSVDLVIKDSSGNIVAKINQKDISEGVNSITWDGTDLEGNTVASGSYTVEISATRTNGTTFTPSLSITGKATSVIYRDGNAYVKINGVEVPLSDISSIGELG
jgi:flagellar basal-body rod modification protein FlgD